MKHNVTFYKKLITQQISASQPILSFIMSQKRIFSQGGGLIKQLPIDLLKIKYLPMSLIKLSSSFSVIYRRNIRKSVWLVKN